jgi:hypothetical protein
LFNSNGKYAGINVSKSLAKWLWKPPGHYLHVIAKSSKLHANVWV